jgi:hypothetical protein
MGIELYFVEVQYVSYCDTLNISSKNRKNGTNALKKHCLRIGLSKILPNAVTGDLFNCNFIYLILLFAWNIETFLVKEIIRVCI